MTDKTDAIGGIIAIISEATPAPAGADHFATVVIRRFYVQGNLNTFHARAHRPLFALIFFKVRINSLYNIRRFFEFSVKIKSFNNVRWSGLLSYILNCLYLRIRTPVIVAGGSLVSFYFGKSHNHV